MGRNFYSVLGVPRNAPQDEIKKAYKKQALMFHPDKNKSPGAAERFKEIAEAYNVLTDPRQREIFDNYGEEGLGFGFAEDPLNVFRDIFGNEDPFQGFMDGLPSDFARIFYTSRSSTSSTGWRRFGDNDFDFTSGPETFKKRLIQDPPIEQNIQVSLEELMTGCSKKLKINRQVLTCNGMSREDKILVIEIKPGWKAGTKITFPKEGDQKPGIIPADIIFVIGDKPHQYFKRDTNNNLLYSAKVSLRDALVGCFVQIPTIDGRVLSVQVNEVIQPGTQKRIPGEGLPLPKNPGQRADMIVSFDIEFPTTLSMEQRQFLASGLV